MKNSNDEHNLKPIGGSAQYIILALLALLPIGAVALVTYNLVVVATPDLLSIGVAVPVGFVIGVLTVFLYVLSFGTNPGEILMASVVIIILSLLMLPVAPWIKAQRLRKKGIVPTQVQKTSEKPLVNIREAAHYWR